MKPPLRSRAWLESADLYGWLRQAAFRSQGLNEESYQGKPIIGIGNSWSELTHCNVHLRQLAEAVKRGVWQAGGCPLEFPVLSLGEFHVRPTSMLLRNLMSMDVEETIRANPLDGVVLLCNCDKTTPAMLMGAASADVPAIVLTGGPQLAVHWRGEVLGSCTDCRRYYLELQAGNLAPADWVDLQTAMIRSPGHCMVMGTASTMACLTEALGMALPGTADIPAVDSRRLQLAERVGRQIVECVRQDLRPSRILTPRAFDNAIRVLHAIGGSTNAVIHLIALAGRLGIELPLARFDELARTTPLLLNLKPVGQYVMEDFFYAGGLSALLTQLAPWLHLDLPTVTGRTLGENLTGARCHNPDVIRSPDRPLAQEGGLVVLRGSLCPRGALLKTAAASPHLLRHRGRAVVFRDAEDLRRRIDDPELDIRPDDVLVLQHCGPVGGPGMPEAGFLPLPKRLLQQGVRDMVRISDARISGTAFGTLVVHVCPEAAVGGPLALVQTGDAIELDVPHRRLDLLVDEAELQRRRQRSKPPAQPYSRGYGWLYLRHVTQADLGCDFDFLRQTGDSRADAALPADSETVGAGPG
jgi:L-arabonate dehydrase